ncbi:MAG: hypothetical protein HZA89_12645 [Verrucomicrobia bacterium]|nr:hypothetical protein [Verrucomicrobiota bacterium]
MFGFTSSANRSEKDQEAFKTLFAVIIVGLFGIIFYAAVPDPSYSRLSVGLLVAAASMASGGFLGFLFGMPRATARNQASHNGGGNNDGANSKPSVEPSTNLEQISDWLTKILVGAGLTQINKIPGKMKELGDFIACGMGGTDADRAFAVSLIVFFGVCGFLAVFLWTRLYMAALLEPEAVKNLRKEFSEADERTTAIVKKLAQSGAERAMEDPLLSEQQAPADKAQLEIAAQLVKNESASQRSATDLMILAFHEFQAQNYKAAVENAEKALAASPRPEMLWKIHNLLGLCYHWQQPPNWKPGDDLSWFNNAKKHYEEAARNKNSSSEELLSQANLCFVYLDAQKYSECEALAQKVIQNAKAGGGQTDSLCDLARIALATAKVLSGDNTTAVEALNQTKNISAFEYLFNPDDLPPRAIKGFSTLAGLSPEVEAFVKRIG